MKAEKGKTAKYLREQRGVPDHIKNNLKAFNKIKKSIKTALKEAPLTVEQISEKTGMDKDKTTYYVMSLVKYGDLAVGEIDDMDEYYTYKLNK